MRITVKDVLEYLAGGMSLEEILADFPYLENEAITACLDYAAHREEHLRPIAVKNFWWIKIFHLVHTCYCLNLLIKT